MSPTLVAVAVVGLAWAYAAVAAARWPSAHLLAIVGAVGLFGGVSTTDRCVAAAPIRPAGAAGRDASTHRTDPPRWCRYLTHPAVHAFVAYQIATGEGVAYRRWALGAIAASAALSVGVGVGVAVGDACDGPATVAALVAATVVGLGVDVSFSWHKYWAVAEAAAIFVIIGADPLDFDSRASHFTWWGLMVLAIFSALAAVGLGKRVAVTAVCLASSASCALRRRPATLRPRDADAARLRGGLAALRQVSWWARWPCPLLGA